MPHAPALPQVAVQFTPRFFVSFVTLAAITAVAPTVSVAAGEVDIATIIGAVVTMVAVMVAKTAGFVTDFAVMVTVPPVGMVVGPE